MIKSEIVDGALHVSASYDVQPDSCPACGVVGQLYRHAKQRQPFRDAPSGTGGFETITAAAAWFTGHGR